MSHFLRLSRRSRSAKGLVPSPGSSDPACSPAAPQREDFESVLGQASVRIVDPMVSDRNPEDELAAELARAAVARAAPHEMRIFNAVSAAYLKNPERALDQRSKDEMLGFGLESLAVLTPYALAIAKPVVLFLLGEVAKHATESSREAVVRLVRRLFGRRDEQPEVQPLSPEQLTRVRELALGKARELDLEEEKAALLADAMVGSLVLGDA